MPRVNGAKGVALLAFGGIAGFFGLAFLSPWAIIPPPPRGLVLLNNLVPLEVWGGIWWLAAAWLIVGAFRQDQSKAMGIFAFMLFVWAASYASSAWDEFHRTGYTVFWLSSAMFLALLIACLAIARLVNAPPVDLEDLQHRVLGDDPGGLGHEH